MKLTIRHTEIAQKALKARCYRPDKAPLLEVGYVFGYINKLNREIGRHQTVYHYTDLNNIKMSKGLAQFLEPRQIKFDINNEGQSNLRDLKHWEDTPLKYSKREVSIPEVERQARLEELLKTNPEAKIDDIPATEEKDVLTETSRKAQIQTCPEWYEYTDFVQDVAKIRVALRIRDCSDTTSVLDAIQDVNVMTVVDKLVVKGCVKWDSNAANAFVPYYVANFNIGLNEDEFQHSVDFMIESMLANNIIEIFSN